MKNQREASKYEREEFEKLAKLQKECNHKIILAISDNKPKRNGPIIIYYCPTCLKMIRKFIDEDKGLFNESKIIDLTDYDIDNDIFPISKYIFNNFEYFYNDEIPEEDMKQSVLSFIQLENNNQNELKLKKK